MAKETTTKKGKDYYYEAVGRRKTSVARVRLTEAKANSFVINKEKDLEKYFDTDELKAVAQDALKASGVESKFAVSVVVNGGGVSSQAGAVRHGVSRALVKYDGELKDKLKKAGYLKRDPRMKERKKPGLKKARKAPQWSKR